MGGDAISTKIRYVLKTPLGLLQGKMAIKFLFDVAKQVGLALPKNWNQLTKQYRMKFLATALPNDFILLCIRERKWTQVRASLYAKIIKQDGNMADLAAPVFDALEYFDDNFGNHPQVEYEDDVVDVD